MYNFFVHPSTLQKMDQVLKMRMSEGAAGYGIYIMMLELLRDSENYRQHYDPAVIAWAMHEPDIERLKRVCEAYDLFRIDENNDISSPWLISTMSAHEERRAKLSAAGKKSAAVKAERKESSLTTLPPPSQGGCNVVERVGQQIINKDKTEKNKKSPLTPGLEGEWENIFSDDFISKVGKAKGAPFDPASGEFDKYKDKNHNPSCVLSLACTYHFTRLQAKALMIATKYAEIGSAELMALVAAKRHCENTKFNPQYPFEYFMSRVKAAHES